MSAYSKFPRCRACGSEDAPHICGGNASYTGGLHDGPDGGGDQYTYKIDKIIQITDTLTDNGDGQTLGLSESGKLYQYQHDLESHPEAHPVTGVKNWHKAINHRWELLVESPKE